jgi:hypothetical protein
MRQDWQGSFRRGAAVAALAAAAGIVLAPQASARDFFSSLFGGLMGAAPAPAVPLPFAPMATDSAPPSRPRASHGAAAYCVRTCDGRYFPLSSTGGRQSAAETCNSLCPASETRVVYGGSIDSAATDRGKSYADLPNAFRYRTELVAGCTCNGKDSGGLASISIDDDPTLRKGDLVAGTDGLVVATRSAGHRGASAALAPLSKSARARFGRLPVVAAQ